MLRLWIGSLILLAPVPFAGAQGDPKQNDALKVEGQLTTEDPKDTVPPGHHFKLHVFKMAAGKTYSIDMESKEFDTYLRLESPDGKRLAENDDRGDGTLHSRIVHKAAKEGDYRIIATTFDGKTGRYTLSVQPTTGASAAFGLIQADFQRAMQTLQQDFNKAKEQEEKDRVLAKFFEISIGTVDRYAKIAEEFPNDPVAKQALAQIQQKLAMVSQSDSPAIAQKLREIMEKGQNDQIRGQAGLSLGQSLQAQSEKAYTKDKAKAEKLQKEAEAVFAKVEEKFKAAGGTIAQQAGDALFELRNLSVGKVAPEIEGEDIDGKKFKLSDYRGKVVVLDFWGHW